MKKIILLVFTITSSFIYGQEYMDMISSCEYTIKQIQDVAKVYFEQKGTGKGTGYKQYKRWEYEARLLSNEKGYVNSSSFYIEELKKYNKKQNERANNRSSRVASGTTASWEALGPTTWTAGINGYSPGTGRLTSIAIDPTNENHMIVGSQTGGVWKTTDKGKSWESLCDNFPNMDVYSLAMDPNNPNIYFWGSKAGGLYKSVNAGVTWEKIVKIALFRTGTINKIMINPIDSNIIFISVDSKGHFRSLDGGYTWTKMNTENRGYDIEFKPNRPNVVYATGFKFHRSIDNGNTWTTIEGDFENSPKQIGVSPAGMDRVYVLEALYGSFSGLYDSPDSGRTFTKKNHFNKNYFGYRLDASDMGKGQAPRDMAIAISETNISDIYIAGINPYRSINGGNTFSIVGHWLYNQHVKNNVGYCHADVDDMVYSGNKLFVVTDGGLFVANNPSGPVNKDYFTDLSAGLGIHQFYKLGVNQSSKPVVVGGSQDNGLNVKGSGQNWKQWFGADGMECFVDRKNSNTFYGLIQNGGVAKTTDGGNSKDPSVTRPPGNGAWVTPFVQNTRGRRSKVYIAYDQVYRSNDGCKSWTSISQNFSDVLFNLTIAPSSDRVLYASDFDKMYKTTNGGRGDWQEVQLPYGIEDHVFINSIAVHPTNAKKVAIAVNGKDKVYVTNNGGNSWTAKSTGLPNFNAITVAWDDNGNDGLYLGMNYGVYYTDNTLSSWENFSNLLPNVQVRELEINKVEGKLYAATYGRGMWKTNLYTTSTTAQKDSNEDILEENVAIVYPNPVDTDFTVSFTTERKAELRLFNSNGKLLDYYKLQTIKSKTIDMSSYASGIYFLRISTETGIITKKIIKI